jgi:thioredoxin 1
MSWAGYLVLGLAAVVTAYVLWTGLSTSGMAGQSVDPLEQAIPGLEAQRAKAVIYCYSQHCGPCRRMTAEIERLGVRHPNVFKLDIMRHHREARAVGIRVTPTTLLVENGRVLKALLGVRSIHAVHIFLGQG